MKCPKCAYVGFQESDRCRHCGYEFSLIEQGNTGPVPAMPRAVESPDRAAPRGTSEARLGRSDDAELVDLPLAAPLPASLLADPQPPPARTPLAVRRTAERPRSRATPHVARRPRPELFRPSADIAPTGLADVAGAVSEAAPPLARVISAAVDLGLLAGIDAAVVYLTAQIASVPIGGIVTLPLVPLGVFVVALNVAYFAVFTANGGQTLGKMATGLRVEATEGALTFGGAVVRVGVAIAGGLVVGAGFLPALFRADRRAVHDQIAHTRVVKVHA